MYIERFEYFCPECKQKGIVTDVLLNPELMLIRGQCPACNLQGTYKVVDRAKLSEEYQSLTEAVQGANHHRDQDVTWSVLRFKVNGA